MPLVDVIRGDISALRALDESLMIDTCTVTTPGTPTWDDNTGTFTPGTSTTVYSGMCQVDIPQAVPGSPVAGEAEWVTAGLLVKLPIAGSESVETGSAVRIDTCAFDSALVGKTFKIVGIPSRKTFATSRRLQCEAVDR